MDAESVLLGQLAEEFRERLHCGELPSVEEYAERYPTLAERIRALFPTLLLVEGAASPCAADPCRLLAVPPGHTGRTGVTGRVARWAQRNPTGAALATALLLGTIVAPYCALTAAREHELAVAAREESQDHLCRSKFEQARALRVSGRFDRRWQVLGLVEEAARLRARERSAAPTEDLPLLADLRQLAVSALLDPGARLQREWVGRPVILTPDSRWALLGKPDRSDPEGRLWRLWLVDLEAGHEASASHPAILADPRQALALSPDGEWLATEESGRLAVVLHGLKHEAHERLADAPPAAYVDSGPCRGLAFSPDGKQLAAVRWAGQSPGQVLLWDLQTRAAPKVLVPDLEPGGDRPDHGHWLAFSSGGRWLALPTAKGVVAIDLREAGTVIRLPFDEPDSTPSGSFAFSSDDSLLAVGYRSNRGDLLLVTWDLAAQALKARVEVNRPSDQLRAARLAAVEVGVDVPLWPPVADGDRMRQAVPDLGTPAFLQWHADGRRLFASNRRNSLVLWEPAWDRPQSATALGPSRCFTFSPDGEFLVVRPRQSDRPFEQVRWRDGMVWEAENFPGSPDGARELFYSRDGRQLAVVGEGGLCVVWDVATGRQTARMRAEVRLQEGLAAFTTNGHFLVGGVNEVWDVTTGQRAWQGREAEVLEALSPNGRFLAVGPRSRNATADDWLAGKRGAGPVTLWDLSRDQKAGELRSGGAADGGLIARGFSADGRWLFTVAESEGREQGILWSVPDGRKHLTIPDTAPTAPRALSADGRLLAVGQEDASVQLWDVARGELLLRWELKKFEGGRLTFAPDGSALASLAGADSDYLTLLDLRALRRRLAEIGLDW